MGSQQVVSAIIVSSINSFFAAATGLPPTNLGGSEAVLTYAVPSFLRRTGILLFCLAFLPATSDTAYAERVRRETAVSTGKSRGHAPAKIDLAQMEQLILTYTNQERKHRGLRPFASSSALRYLARTQSKNMCATGHFEHESESFPVGWRRFGERLQLVRLSVGAENIAYRTFSGRLDRWALSIMKGWMNSPEHRRNILNPRYRYVGVGVAPCANRIVYAGQVFSSRPGRVPVRSRGAARSGFDGRCLLPGDLADTAIRVFGVAEVDVCVLDR